jgi:hypothetical protein
MTKGEIRKARKEARAKGIPLTGELAVSSQKEQNWNREKSLREGWPKPASRTEQHARYIDCGPSNWDDR